MAQTGTFEAAAPGYTAAGTSTRWVQLLLGFIVMMTISSPQYVWTLFVPSFQKTTGVDSLRSAMDDHHPDRAADLAVADPGLSGRASRSETADRPRRGDERRRLDGVVLHRLDLGALCHLRPALRRRHRHRLYRHHRPDGAMVSRPARLRDRRGGGRLRLRRHPDDIPDRRHAQGVRLSAHAGRVRRDLRRHRPDRRADAAGAARWRRCRAVDRGRRRVRATSRRAPC